MAAIHWAAILTLCSLAVVHGELECMMFEWEAEDDDPMKGLYIKGLGDFGKKVDSYTGLTDPRECFEKCCESAANTDIPEAEKASKPVCNAASYYPDSDGNNQCYLLSCVPFSECKWAKTQSNSSLSGFMYITNATGDDELAAIEEEVESNLQWNIPDEDHDDQGEDEDDQGEDQDEEGQKEMTTTSTQAQTTTTQAAATTTEKKAEEVTTTPAPQPTGEPDWPPAPAGVNAGQTAAGDTGADTGDLVKGTDQAEDQDADADSYRDGDPGSRVNVPVVVACVIAAIGLIVVLLVIVIRRMQIERDRSIYRPLMDDINSRGFRETDPLH